MYGGIQEYIHRIGRTARIGHQGLATSFYNERSEDMAQDLVNVLVECDCAVPEFLQHLTPEDGKIQFDDDTDDEEEANANGDGGFGDGFGGENAEGGMAVDSAWGGAAPTNGDAGFAADAGVAADPAADAAASAW